MPNRRGVFLTVASKRIYWSLLVVLISVSIGAVVLAQGGGYWLRRSVLSGGGAHAESQSYRINYSFGQPSTVGLSVGEDYQLRQGYWRSTQLATPVPTQPPPTLPPPTCSWKPCTQGQQPVSGYQPFRYDLRAGFNSATTNNLGDNGPAYPSISNGLPPELGGSGITYEPVSSARPIPNVVPRGVAWNESTWIQFGEDAGVPDNQWSCTLLHVNDNNSCDYGIMQLNTCMSQDECPGFEPERVANNPLYNQGAGVYLLINKWREINEASYFIGNNDHTVPADWYYSVIAYNYFSPGRNGPNLERFNPWRFPFLEKGSERFTSYPYQEQVWGLLANPRTWKAGDTNDHPLWRPTRVPWIPRGIFGTTYPDSNWYLPEWTPQPVFFLVPGLWVTSDDEKLYGPTIQLSNPTDKPLAADIMLYDANGDFNRPWLGRPEGPYEDPSAILVSPGGSIPVFVPAAFELGQTFSGYARISANSGMIVTFSCPSGEGTLSAGSCFAPYMTFLPAVYKSSPGGNYCPLGDNSVTNGGFESFGSDGYPIGWNIHESTDGYSLADGTWFQSGHYGAYLGGYDSAHDKLEQDSINMPDGAELVFSWYMRGQEWNGNDKLHIYLKNQAGETLYQKDISSFEAKNVWIKERVVFPDLDAQPVNLIFEVYTDDLSPTSFFIDDVSISVCGAP